jgi:hypothetical protein
MLFLFLYGFAFAIWDINTVNKGQVSEGVGRANNIGFTINTLRRAIILLSKIGDIKGGCKSGCFCFCYMVLLLLLLYGTLKLSITVSK